MPIRISDATKRRAATSAFRTMERVAPPLAGRTAAHLFFYVGRPPLESKRRKHEPDGGDPFEVSVDGHTVRGTVYGPASGEPVYLVHGWAGWWQREQEQDAPCSTPATASLTGCSRPCPPWAPAGARRACWALAWAARPRSALLLAKQALMDDLDMYELLARGPSATGWKSCASSCMRRSTRWASAPRAWVASPRCSMSRSRPTPRTPPACAPPAAGTGSPRRRLAACAAPPG
jgi:hypothetical protein